MKKTFVLDTNVLLHNPNVIHKFKDNDVIIPIRVIEEIDKFKKGMNEIGQNARYISRILDEFRKKGSLANGVKISTKNSGKLFVLFSEKKEKLLESLEANVDNSILSSVVSLKKEIPNLVLITNDSNLRIKSDVLGIKAQELTADKVNINELYEGYSEIEVDDDTLSPLYEGPGLEIDLSLKPNEYVKINKKIPTKYSQNKLIAINSKSIWGIYPRNIEQIFAMDALLDDSIRLVTLIGQAGTGKTLLALAAGLAKVTDENKYSKLIVSRPVIPMGKDIGFLPGTIEEKMNPWMQPIYDNLEFILTGGDKKKKNNSKDLIMQGMLEIEALTFIRGRSIPNVLFILDEAQNLSPHEVKTILTRAGEGTKIILTGDPYQIDNPFLDSANNGLTYVVEKFKNEKISAHITLKKGERSQLATLAANLL